MIHKGVLGRDMAVGMRYGHRMDLGALFSRFHWSNQRDNMALLSKDTESWTGTARSSYWQVVAVSIQFPDIARKFSEYL